mmetsp:Transcript_5536/g.5964  ORF Transcript_5536/g.5964 Transcript_5536/m.5964 type:complete len:277 (+) Transcript_5536:30-860(+)
MSCNIATAVASSDAVVQSLKDLLATSTSFARETEATFLRDELYLRERISNLDKLSGILLEERRLLELQLQDSRQHAQYAKSKTSTLHEEAKQVHSALSQPFAQLEREEQRLDEQHLAFKSKLQDVMQVAAQLDERLVLLQTSESQLESEESVLYNRERDYENAKREMIALEQEVENRRRSLERREESISNWIRALDARDAELAKCQMHCKDDLHSLEVEERALGWTEPRPATHNSVAIPHLPGHPLSQRAVMDDHEMTIDRDDESDVDDPERDTEM